MEVYVTFICSILCTPSFEVRIHDRFLYSVVFCDLLIEVVFHACKIEYIKSPRESVKTLGLLIVPFHLTSVRTYPILLWDYGTKSFHRLFDCSLYSFLHELVKLIIYSCSWRINHTPCVIWFSVYLSSRLFVYSQGVAIRLILRSIIVLYIGVGSISIVCIDLGVCLSFYFPLGTFLCCISLGHPFGSRIALSFLPGLWLCFPLVP